MEKRRVAVRGIIHKDGKLLAVKHKTHDGGAADFWAIPGGGLNIGESIHEGLVREMIEETGIKPEVGRLMIVQQYPFTHHDGKTLEHFELLFEVTNADDYESIDLASTSHGDIEIAEYGFIDPNKENILPTILRTPKFQAALADPHAELLFHTELD